jgi:hypothetical protein
MARFPNEKRLTGGEPESQEQAIGLILVLGRSRTLRQFVCKRSLKCDRLPRKLFFVEVSCESDYPLDLAGSAD